MSEKVVIKFGGSSMVILVMALLGIINGYSNITMFLFLVLILNMIFFITTFILYCRKRKKFVVENNTSKKFLNILSDDGNNKYVLRKLCEEGCIYVFQYLNEDNKKMLVAMKTSYIQIKEIEKNEKPYVQLTEKMYIPKKQGLLEHLYYDREEEEENKNNYTLYINNEMIFS